MGRASVDNTIDFTPLVLLVDDQEWTSRSIESILRPKGHVVLKAYTGEQALGLVGKVNPDALLVDIHLPDIDGIELVRRVREAEAIHPATPILMITGGAVDRPERLRALGAGAWDVLTHPVDPNELLLRLETFIRAKQDSDRIRDRGLTDPDSGLYNARGVLQRAKEISSDASRFGPPGHMHRVRTSGHARSTTAGPDGRTGGRHPCAEVRHPRGRRRRTPGPGRVRCDRSGDG